MDLRLTRLQLNELELIVDGAYGRSQRYELPGAGEHVATLRVPLDSLPDELVLLDTEATPIASVDIEASAPADGGLWVAGHVRHLREPSQPPFPELRPRATRDDIVDAALLVIGNTGTPHLGTGAVVLVDDGDADALSRAVKRAQREGHDVRVLPQPAAEHLDADQTTELLAHLAGVVCASSLHLTRAPRAVSRQRHRRVADGAIRLGQVDHRSRTHSSPACRGDPACHAARWRRGACHALEWLGFLAGGPRVERSTHWLGRITREFSRRDSDLRPNRAVRVHACGDAGDGGARGPVCAGACRNPARRMRSA